MHKAKQEDGQYQMLIDEASRHLTAFRTAFGIFEWNRLPMGLKGAGSYYQSHMQNTVLTDLQSVICRLEKFGMTINPKQEK